MANGRCAGCRRPIRPDCEICPECGYIVGAKTRLACTALALMMLTAALLALSGPADGDPRQLSLIGLLVAPGLRLP